MDGPLLEDVEYFDESEILQCEHILWPEHHLSHTATTLRRLCYSMLEAGPCKQRDDESDSDDDDVDTANDRDVRRITDLLESMGSTPGVSLTSFTALDILELKQLTLHGPCLPEHIDNIAEHQGLPSAPSMPEDLFARLPPSIRRLRDIRKVPEYVDIKDSTAPPLANAQAYKSVNMSRLSQNLLLALSAAALVAAGTEPNFPYDEANTTPYCTWWVDYDGSGTCSTLLEEFGATLADFTRWNPSVSGSECAGLAAGRSYCVEAFDEPTPGTPTTLTSVIVPSTTTKPGNGVSTPTPTQPGMVDNCSKFFFVADGMSCETVLSENKISVKELFAWNPTVKDDCTGLWGEVYVCVNIIGRTVTTTPASATPSATNVPSPIQTPVVSNCNKYHKVASTSTTCQAIADYWGLKMADFNSWNPSINSACSNLKVGYHVCVGVLPAPIQTPVAENCNKYHKVSSSSTTCQAIADYNDIKIADFFKWNPSITNPACSNLKVSSYVCVGVLPSPIQTPVVANCNKYHLVSSSTTTCQAIADYNKISISDFFKWNPKIANPACSNLMLKYYVCVGVPGATNLPTAASSTVKPPATTTKAGNGVATPTPIQPNMTKNCKSFHLASQDTTTCQGIADYRKIKLADFYKWNPDVGSTCKNLWKGYYYCWAVL
ncbi:hypothetical protein N0V88_002303 [Collariella sp. IMI 366227]|nr:hypothetical protein N0V88_002303 [Collariella sp. IMI 366227]